MRLNRLLLLLAVVVPVVACVLCVKSIKEINKDDTPASTSTDIPGVIILSGDPVDSGTTDENTETIEPVSGEMAGEEYVSYIGAPLSKISQDATVAISVAYIYKDADEKSEIVGTMQKYDSLTAQKYPQGWSRVQNSSVSGWMRTENINYPSSSTVLSDNSVVGRTGIITADPSLNLRSKPEINNNNVITGIPYQTTVTIQDVADGWYKVSYASSIGWVSSEYVEIK